MKNYECKICNFSSRIKTHYNKHLETKKHIKNENKNKEIENKEENPKKCKKKVLCKYCNKEFTCKRSVYRHINELRCKKIPTESKDKILEKCNNKKIKKEKNNQIISFNEEKETLREILKQEREKYKKEIESLITKIGNITNNGNINYGVINNNITYNTTNNIIINNYGNEDISHITEDFMINLLKGPDDMIPKMVNAIHFNKDKPENKNIIISSSKDNMFKVFENGKWINKEKNETLFDLVDGKYYMLDSFYNEMKDNNIKEFNTKLKKEDMERYDNFSKEYDKECERPNNSKFIDNIKDKCFYVIISNKDNLYLE